MNNVDILYKMIKQGKEGKNIGYSTGIPKLDEYTGGVREGVYTLIYGLSGSGKSSLALYSYIYRPLKDNPDADIKLIYLSLEMSTEILLSKLLCIYIYEEYGKVIPYSKLMSWQEVLSDEDYEYALKGEQWLKSINNKLIIYDKSLTNKSFYHLIMSLLEQWGTFEEVDDGKRTIYIKNNPKQLVQVIIDHISLVTPIDGHTRKGEIDLISSYCVSLRERCRVSFVVLQQENRNTANMDRIKADMSEGSLDCLKDSGNTGNDCEVCIQVYNPLKFKLKTHVGYPIILEDNGDQNSFLGLRDRYRALVINKNRYGVSDRIIPVNFFGELGIVMTLPSPKTVTDWRPYISLLPQMSDTEDEVQQEPKKELMYSF
jgi:energy-coupling factor transporter ATP-binding protein EcfA2